MVKENHLYLNNTMTILNKHSLKDRERYLLIIVLKDVLGLELYFDQNLIYYVYSSCFFFSLAHATTMHFQEMEKMAHQNVGF